MHIGHRIGMAVRRVSYKVADRLPPPRDEEFRRVLRRLRDLAERTRPRRLSRRVWRRVRPSDSAVELRLDEIEELLAEPLPREHGKFAFRSRLLQSEADLERMIGDGVISPRLLMLHARLAVRLAKRRESERRWSLLLSTFPGHEAQALTQIAQARRKLGDLKGASHALDRVPRNMAQAPQVTSERARLHAELEAVEAGTLLARYIEEVRDGVSSPSHLLRHALDGQRIPEAHLGAVTDLVERACQVLLSGRLALAESENTVDREPRPATEAITKGPSGPPVLLTAGFGWSGSSAVKDFLLESPDVSLPFPPPELSLLCRRAHNVPVLDVLSAARKGRPWHPTLLRFLLTSVLGLWFTGTTGLRRERMRRMSVLGHVLSDEPATRALLAACHHLLDRLEAQPGPNAEDRLIITMRPFFDEMVMTRSVAGTHYLLDNAVTARHASLVSMFSNAHLIASFRDPRDQFVARMYEQLSPDTRRGSNPVDTFIRQIRSMYRQFERARAHPVLGRRVIRVQFEEMVADPDARMGLLKKLKVEPANEDTKGKHFDPNRSRENIGIFRRYPHEKDIRKIEASLPEYVVGI